MLLWSFLLLAFLTLSLGAIEAPKALHCSDPDTNPEKCGKRVDSLVAIVPGASYAASIECTDCLHDDLTEPGLAPTKDDHILFLNLTLSHNRRAILLNEVPIHPLQTIPTPPPFHATQFPSTFSNTNLSSGINCPNPFCHPAVDDCVDWCRNLPLSTIKLDYVYTKKLVDYKGPEQNAESAYWEVSLDVIGGRSVHKTDPHWKYDDASQKMVWMLVAGKEISSREADTKAADDLFNPAQEGDKTYEYHFIDVKLKQRVFKFPAKNSLSGWAKIRRFFGTDIWGEDGSRFLFLEEEWGSYGKQGTLRNTFGEFVHSDIWPIVGIVFAVIVGGFSLILGGYHLHGWLMHQRELANWNGMDAVWDSLRRESALEEEEEEDLLGDGYRDDPDEGGSSTTARYTDEPQTMKPLPSKPLPEKPLPAVPLIDT